MQYVLIKFTYYLLHSIFPHILPLLTIPHNIMYSFFKISKSILCCEYVHEYRAIHWNLGSLSEARIWKTNKWTKKTPNPYCPFQQPPTVYNSSSARGGTLWFLPNPCCCELICPVAQACPENITLKQPSTSLASYYLSVTFLWWSLSLGAVGMI